MGQIDRVDEVRRRATRASIAEPEEAVGPKEVRILDAAGNIKRTISPAALRQLGDVVPASHATQIAPRNAERASVPPSPKAWRRATSGRKRTAA